MSDTFQELADIPKVRLPPARMLITYLSQSIHAFSNFANFSISQDFIRDGMQFVNRCTKR